MGSVNRRPNGVWRARFRDHDGKQHAAHKPTKAAAVAWLRDQEAALTTGRWIDPAKGRVTFADYAEDWRAIAAHRPGTAVQVERLLRLHAYPAIGNKPIGAIRRSDLQALVKVKSVELAPNTLTVLVRWLAVVFSAAVDDGIIPSSPTKGCEAAPPRAHAGRPAHGRAG